jgi:hypothetical protein
VATALSRHREPDLSAGMGRRDRRGGPYAGLTAYRYDGPADGEAARKGTGSWLDGAAG